MKIDLRTNVAGAAPIAEGSAARKVAGAIARSSFARSGATGGFGRSGRIDYSPHLSFRLRV